MKRRTLLMAGGAALSLALVPGAMWASARADQAGARVIRARLSAARRAAELRELALRPEMMTLARRHTVLMRTLGHVTHSGPAGEDPPARALLAGYGGVVLGEALADTLEQAEHVAETWLSTPATRAVLLNREAVDMGLFGLRTADGRTWWDLVLGRVPSAETV